MTERLPTLVILRGLRSYNLMQYEYTVVSGRVADDTADVWVRVDNATAGVSFVVQEALTSGGVLD